LLAGVRCAPSRDMNPLTDVIPAKARRYVYAAFAFASTLLVICGIFGFDPDTIGKCAAALGVLGTAVGATAASNTAQPSDPEVDEPTP
jgi:hypothetical protein